MAMQRSTQYRADIDGLRAFAVLAVILYHAKPGLLPGGFLGVDVFFVISGFLITGILHKEFGDGTFSFGRFFERRVRRLFPAFFVMAVATVIVSWRYLMPMEMRELGAGLTGAALALANMVFFLRTDYFAPAAELNPMLHTWSLSVEEQFYLVFPVLLLVLWRLHGGRLLLPFLVCLFFVSLVLMVVGSEHNQAAAFYLLPFRMWELLAGSLLAIAMARGSAPRFTAGSPLGPVSLALLILILAIDPKLFVSSVIPVFLAVACTVILLVCRGTGAQVRLLVFRPFVAIGLISYSLYLWHQPVLAIARQVSLDGLSDAELTGLILFVFALSFLSWKFVEVPFRNPKTGSRAAVFGSYVVLSGGLAAFGVFAFVSNGIPARLDPEVSRFASMAQWNDKAARACHVSAGSYKEGSEFCTHGDDAPKRIVVWGDSHGVELSGALDRQLEDIEIEQITFSGCPPIVGFRNSDVDDICTNFHSNAKRYIIEDNDVDTVVIAIRYAPAIKGLFDNGIGGVEYSSIPHLPLKSIIMPDATETERRTLILDAYRETVTDMVDTGKTVVLVYPIPEQGWIVPSRMARVALVKGVDAVDRIGVPLETYLERQSEVIEMLDAIPDVANLVRIRPAEVFCKDGLCRASDDQRRALYFDDDHPSTVGADLVATQIIKALGRTPF